MRKRERENPCGVCGHYHKYEEGEVCGICGHRMPVVAEKSSFQTVPTCQNLYKNSFTYHCLQDDQILAFDDAIQFLEQCEKDRARVLVHCMSGKNRSPAIVIAYLMKSKGWRLGQSYQWVKERRPSVDITQAIYQQLQEYEQKLFGSVKNSITALPSFSASGMTPFSFGFAKPNDSVPAPAFNSTGSLSIFARSNLDVPPREFTFGAGPTQTNTSNSPLGSNPSNPNSNDVAMDGS